MAASNVIDYYAIDTTANASDFGDLTVARESSSGVSDGTYGVFGGGSNGAYVNTIDYISFDTPANASDFGDLIQVIAVMAGVDDSHE
jgi:hypothetical protein